jgi:Short C-terminal domain/Phospholipase_D-nuclease N-terminal
MLIAADYPFLDVLWSMLIFFALAIWIFIAFTVLVDVLRRDDIGGWGKAAWVVFVIVLPFLGVLIYVITQHWGIYERSEKQTSQWKVFDFDRSVREPAGGPAAEIAKAKELLDAGTITQAEFDAIKAKALS